METPEPRTPPWLRPVLGGLVLLGLLGLGGLAWLSAPSDVQRHGVLALAAASIAVGCAYLWVERWQQQRARALYGQWLERIGRMDLSNLSYAPGLPAPWLRDRLNALVDQLRRLTEQRAAQTASLESQLARDPLTQTATRERFMQALEDTLATLPTAATSTERTAGLLVVRTTDLKGINDRLGRSRADELLRSLAAQLRLVIHRSTYASGLVARLNGSDFGILVPRTDGDGLTRLVQDLAGMLRLLHDNQLSDQTPPARIAAVLFDHRDTRASAMSRVDLMVMQAEQHNAAQAVNPECGDQPGLMTVAEWRDIIDHGVSTGQLALTSTDYRGPGQATLVQALGLRLQGPQDRWFERDELMGPAIRCDRSHVLDRRLLEMTVEHLARQPAPVLLEITTQALGHPSFVLAMRQLLRASAGQRSTIRLGFPQGTLGPHMATFLALVAEAGPLNCQFGLTEFNGDLRPLMQMPPDVPLFLKLDTAAGADPGLHELFSTAIALARQARGPAAPMWVLASAAQADTRERLLHAGCDAVAG